MYRMKLTNRYIDTFAQSLFLFLNFSLSVNLTLYISLSLSLPSTPPPLSHSLCYSFSLCLSIFLFNSISLLFLFFSHLFTDIFLSLFLSLSCLSFPKLFTFSIYLSLFFRPSHFSCLPQFLLLFLSFSLSRYHSFTHTISN